MKLKKLHFIGSVMAAGIAIATLSSNSSGIMGRSTAGCDGSGCHGTRDQTNVIIGLTGIPSGGWVPGTTYPLTLTVTNTTQVKAGFDLTVSVGTLSAGSTGTAIMGPEIHHTTPQTLASGTATWTFSWTAPASRATPLTVSVAGNTVNGNGSADAADHWNTKAFSFTAANAASISNTFSEAGYSIYPNPAKDQLTLTAKAGKEVSVSAASINGTRVALSMEKVAADKYQVNTANLSAGVYVLMLNADGKTYSTRFVKQ